MFYVKQDIPVESKVIVAINDETLYTKCLRCSSECKPARQDADGRVHGYFAKVACPNCIDDNGTAQEKKITKAPMFYLRAPFASGKEPVIDITNRTIYTRCLNCSVEYEAMRLEVDGKLRGFINQSYCPNCHALSGNVPPSWMGKSLKDMSDEEHQAYRQSMIDAANYSIKALVEVTVFDELVPLDPQLIYDMFEIPMKLLECLTLHEFEKVFNDEISNQEEPFADIERLAHLYSPDVTLGADVLLPMYFSVNPVWKAFFEKLIWVANNTAEETGESNPYSDFAKRESFICNYNPAQTAC